MTPALMKYTSCDVAELHRKISQIVIGDFIDPSYTFVPPNAQHPTYPSPNMKLFSKIILLSHLSYGAMGAVDLKAEELTGDIGGPLDALRSLKAAIDAFNSADVRSAALSVKTLVDSKAEVEDGWSSLTEAKSLDDLNLAPHDIAAIAKATDAAKDLASSLRRLDFTLREGLLTDMDMEQMAVIVKALFNNVDMQEMVSKAESAYGLYNSYEESGHIDSNKVMNVLSAVLGGEEGKRDGRMGVDLLKAAMSGGEGSEERTNLNVVTKLMKAAMSIKSDNSGGRRLVEQEAQEAEEALPEAW